MAKSKLTREAKRVLNVIDEALAKGNKSSMQIWDVISALRGPDVHGFPSKAKTTVHIRTAALPKTAKTTSYTTLPISFAHFASPLFDIEAGSLVSDHFRLHIAKAAVVLGLVEENANS